jgi:ABC-type antimicrobial peptide transport system ATPase subunit
VGSKLMDKVKAWCCERNMEELIVWPSERSVRFYERAGFKTKNDVMEMVFE